MSRFLALITMAAMALFIAGPAMAQETKPPLTVTKKVDNSNEASTKFDTKVTVTKDTTINVKGDLKPTGGVNVSGDSIFKELDVNVQDQENVVKFFELDDSATSKWTISGTGVMNVAEQLQNGSDNLANISQNPKGSSVDQMNVGLQYQVGIGNAAGITQRATPTISNNFAKQIQIGGSVGHGNNATIGQN